MQKAFVRNLDTSPVGKWGAPRVFLKGLLEPRISSLDMGVPGLERGPLHSGENSTQNRAEAARLRAAPNEPESEFPLCRLSRLDSRRHLSFLCGRLFPRAFVCASSLEKKR